MSTITITEGVSVSTSRLSLKAQMDRFGEIDVCHMGSRTNPEDEPPWIRFKDPQACERAVEAINRGEVYVDGIPIKATVRNTRRAPPPPPQERGVQRRDLEVNSRDLFMERQRDRGRDRDRRRSRSDSRNKKRRRDRKSSSSSSSSRSRSRSKDRKRR
eukprot:gnl/TRDRNA2_/TRDRNA2_68351_c0_seq1.p3 gnl/TRDRNA2_/TRDRNA2_68351_c0~~gnl/TRDRNA2_/TRDRNA2_68351_c0_seq1.p3  ORF type:complete len:158 (-),score=17.06 gnl/TRDRNA2_/TRDRNA2_68351_c0_seq1:300-773(-)